jgi:mannose-6-phosphate isomerase-like protein (cupin superfamily)
VTVSARQSKHKISIHLAADARDSTESDFFQLTEEQLAPLLLAGEALAAGSKTTELVRDAAGFSLVHVWWKPNFPLPQHSHNDDCLYYVISGSAIMGHRTLRAGDSFLVTADTPYQYTAGPEGAEVLEIRFRAEHIDMTCYGSPESYAKKAADALETNREIWENAKISPTFTANQARQA